METRNVWEPDMGYTNSEVEEYGLQDWDNSSDAGYEGEFEPTAVEYNYVEISSDEEALEINLEASSDGSSDSEDPTEDESDEEDPEEESEPNSILMPPYFGTPEAYSPLSYDNEPMSENTMLPDLNLSPPLSPSNWTSKMWVEQVRRHFGQNHQWEQLASAEPIPPTRFRLKARKRLQRFAGACGANMLYHRRRMQCGEGDYDHELSRVRDIEGDLEQDEWLLENEGEVMDANLLFPDILDRFCYPPSPPS